MSDPGTRLDAASAALAEGLGHRFARPELLLEALTHRSALDGAAGRSYERLEFLGDAVIGLVAAEWLGEREPEAPEGELARARSYLVSRKVLSHAAKTLGVGEALRLSVGEQRSGGRRKASLLADAFEAVIGAVYADAGLDAARRVIVPVLAAALERDPDLAGQDAKTVLQEIIQARSRELPEYRLIEEQGPPHEKSFSVECWIEGVWMGSGSGPSKKIAERRAALEALRALEGSPPGREASP
ncbi:MAG TPA: ribonuclease III [Thermoanaerobaculia bacterium]|nr:ribonuclease III [Thermoanaerobaculia bacterium]